MHLFKAILKLLGILPKKTEITCRICTSTFQPNPNTKLQECPICHSLNPRP